MKKIFIIIYFLSISVLFSQNINIDDYEKPISSAQLLRLNGNWNWSQIGDSVTSNIANANVIFNKFYSSLPFAWFIDANLRGTKNRNDYSHSVEISALGRKYIFEEKDIFTSAKLHIQHEHSYQQIASDIVVAAGYGRYIDATALAKAVRLEELLLNEKIIVANLPKHTMIKIANIIERKNEYENLYTDVYETFWISDIEKEIKASGMLRGESIGALGIIRIRQVLFDLLGVVNNRSYGWDISLGSRFEISTKDKSNVGAPRLDILGNYSYPIGWRMQINTKLEANSPLDTNFMKKYDLTLTSNFIYELSNKINFLTTYKFKLQKSYFSNPISTHEFIASFLFYIENKIYFGVNANVIQVEDKPRISSMSMSIQYTVF